MNKIEYEESGLVDLFINSRFETFNLKQKDLPEHTIQLKNEIEELLPKEKQDKVSCLIQGVMNFMQEIEYAHLNQMAYIAFDIGKEMQIYQDRDE